MASGSRRSSTCPIRPTGGSRPSGWSCTTIVDCEAMSKDDAMFIARSYAVEHDIPVIYECHAN